VSKEQWGHGYYAGVKDAQKSSLGRVMVDKHRTDCLCVGCQNYPCGLRCDERSCVIDCVLYVRKVKNGKLSD